MSERTSNTAERLKELMRERNMRQADIVAACQPFADKYGVKIGKTDVSQYVKGKVVPGQDKLTVLSMALNVSEVWLMGYDVPESKADFERIVKQPVNVIAVEKKRLPILGNIACGEPVYADEDWQGWVDVDADLDADFCLRATGDSMTGDRIYDGDIVFIHSQPVVENGEIAAVLVGDEATLKRVSFDEGTGVLQLFPSNPTYPILRYTGAALADVRILGKAVRCQFDLNK